MIRHGYSAYAHALCRCAVCRAAHTAYRRERRRKVHGNLPATVPHGSASTYQNWGCRCRACLDAQLAAQRDRRMRKKASA